jgi:hypothetical protein
MSHTIVRESIRQSINDPFWEFDQTTDTYFTETYLDTGLSLGRTITYSPDELTQYRTNTWRSIDAWITFSNDPVMTHSFGARDQYNQDNNIYSCIPEM